MTNKSKKIEFGGNLKNILKHKRIYQRELAEQTNIPLKTIEKYIANVFLPKLENAIKIAKALDVSLDDLCFEKKQNEQNNFKHDNTEDCVKQPSEINKTEEKIDYFDLEMPEFQKVWKKCLKEFKQHNLKKSEKKIIKKIIPRYYFKQKHLVLIFNKLNNKTIQCLLKFLDYFKQKISNYLPVKNLTITFKINPSINNKREGENYEKV